MRRASERIASFAKISLGHSVSVDRPSEAAQRVARFAHMIPPIILQLAGLSALNAAGVWIVAETALPIPGNLIGMVALSALLALGVVKLCWIETTGSFLIKHLAFFFVPITVGLMDAGSLFAAHGLSIVVVLVASAGFGILLAGWTSQCLIGKPRYPEGKP